MCCLRTGISKGYENISSQAHKTGYFVSTPHDNNTASLNQLSLFWDESQPEHCITQTIYNLHDLT